MNNHTRWLFTKWSLSYLAVLKGMALSVVAWGQDLKPNKILEDVRKENTSLQIEAWFKECTRLDIKGPNHSEMKDGFTPRVLASTVDVAIIKEAAALCRRGKWRYAEELQGQTISTAGICEFRLWKDKKCLSRFVFLSYGQLLLIYEVDGKKVEWWYDGLHKVSISDEAWRNLYNARKASWTNLEK